MTCADLWLHGLQVKVSWYEGSDGLGVALAASLSGTTSDELKRGRDNGNCNALDGKGLNLDDCVDGNRSGDGDTAGKVRRVTRVRNNDRDCMVRLWAALFECGVYVKSRSNARECRWRIY